MKYLIVLIIGVKLLKIFFVTDSHVTCVLANRFSELEGENKHYVLTH